MNLLQEALRAGHAPPVRRGHAHHRALLVIGGAGALGAEVLHQLLASRRFRPLGVMVDQPLGIAMPGLTAIDTAADQGVLSAYDTAVVVFDRQRHANGRERAFTRPEPAGLLALAARLAGAGVQRLIVVTPHAPSSLPNALRHGLADLDEQAVANLGFEQLLFMRPSQTAAAVRVHNVGERVAGWALSALSMMIPRRDQPVRSVKIAELAAQLAHHLADAPAGTRVVPPEMVWQAAQTTDVSRLASDWLAGRAPPPPTLAPPRL